MQRSTLVFVPLCLLAVAAFSGAMVSNGTRLDRDDVEPAPASHEETVRQGMAQMAAQIEDSARRTHAASLVTAAADWTEALGGVWVAWPSGAPSGHTNAPVETTGPSDAAALTNLLGSFAEKSASAGYTSVALGARLAAVDRGASCPTTTLADVAQLATTSADLNELDAARQWLEDDAASLTGDAKSAALARIDNVSALESAAIAAGAKDQRPAVVPPVDKATTRALETITTVLLNGATDAEQRATAVNYACSLYTSAGERASAGSLPGSTASSTN